MLTGDRECTRLNPSALRPFSAARLLPGGVVLIGSAAAAQYDGLDCEPNVRPADRGQA